MVDAGGHIDEEPEKKEEEKLEFTSEGEALGYISMDQARVLALQHARDNREPHGRYADQELTWEVVSTEETEDYYEVTLSYLPVQGFTGRPGIELLTLDKIGGIEFRQIVSPPRPRRVTTVTLLLLLSIVAVGAVIGVLLGTGTFSSGITGQVGGVSVPSAVGSSVVVPIFADQTTLLTSPEGDVRVRIPSGSVDTIAELSYTTLFISDVPPLPEDIVETPKVFDLAISRDGIGRVDNFSFNSPVLVTVKLSLATIESAETNGSMIIIQHYGTSEGWQELPTTVDSNESTATASVSSLSPFAITVKSSEPLTTNNADPLALDDAATITRGSELLIDVLANDTDPDDDVITINAVTQGSNGAVEFTSDGIIYTHGGSEVGFDQFNYTVIDSRGATANASVMITVVSVTPDFTPTPVPTDVPTAVPTPLPALGLITVLEPTPTPTLVPTPTPIPGHRLNINQAWAEAGQAMVPVPYGTVLFSPIPREDGKFQEGKRVELGAYPDSVGWPVNWTGVDTSYQNTASVIMDRTRYVIVEITPGLGVPTPTPMPTRTPTPTPTPHE